MLVLIHCYIIKLTGDRLKPLTLDKSSTQSFDEPFLQSMDETLEFFYTDDELGKYILLKQNQKRVIYYVSPYTNTLI